MFSILGILLLLSIAVIAMAGTTSTPGGIDMGIATDWEEGQAHNQIINRQNQKYKTTPKRDILIQSPVSIEFNVNSNLSNSQEADKIFFTTYHGSTKKIIGILDSNGNLFISGKVHENQGNLSYD